jgi:hypothetical protein
LALTSTLSFEALFPCIFFFSNRKKKKHKEKKIIEKKKNVEKGRSLTLLEQKKRKEK